MKVPNAKTIRHAAPSRVLTLIKERLQPVLLLGAGASIKSGIPDAYETVNRAAKWAWCKEHGRSNADPSVVKSDWYPWLEGQYWFKKDVNLADQYPVAIDNLLGITDDRREFFEYLINPGIEPSEGYQILAKILDKGWVTTVLTTNFDHCLYRARDIENVPPFLVEIRTVSDWRRFMVSPTHPQLIHLHGSVEHYSDKNLSTEVATLDFDIVEKLRPLLRDHPLVVIGYRGTEGSVMNDLLIDQSDYTNRFHKGIFWCEIKRSFEEPLSPLVQKLANKIGTNFSRVQIDGFDECMRIELFDQLQADEAFPSKPTSTVPSFKLPPDMEIFSSGSFEDIDQHLLLAHLKQYADKHGESTPTQFQSKWARDFAITRNLARVIADGTTIRPTLAGWLLFAKKPTQLLPHAAINLTVIGSEYWLKSIFGDDVDLYRTCDENEFEIKRTIGGTLWNQLNVLMELMAILNSPFVLKEAKSRQVTPYHPQVLKEMIVNALVHRDYKVKEPICIRVTHSNIEAISPGGLIDQLFAKTSKNALEDLIRDGYRGKLKGYRNPLVSGMFYGSSEMDRKGSGLSDMFQKTMDNNGDIRFGPIKGNTAFRVVIYARPETVDIVTQTAVADQSETVRYISNIVEIVSFPDRLWYTKTNSRFTRGLTETLGDSAILPGYIQKEIFYTFYNLTSINSNLHTPIDPSTIREISLQELHEHDNGSNILLKLLYQTVSEHLRTIGLVVDDEKRRAHFPLGTKLSRKITYRGAAKRATRTVVKARMKRDSDRVLYFEHKAFSYSIKRFGSFWGMFINPGYVFTRDGNRRYLGRERLNVLSTKRAAHDFNPNVRHDLIFWMACLSKESEGVFQLKTEKWEKFQDYGPTIILSSSFPSIAFNSEGFNAKRIVEGEIESTLLDVDIELEKLVSIENQDSNNIKIENFGKT